jgi:hypothetical protein
MMTYDAAFERLTEGLCYGPVSARGLIHAARIRGSITDAGTVITCRRHATDAARDRFRIESVTYRPDRADQPCTCDPAISRRQCAERDAYAERER